ncbi:unnamed protein product [Phytomonas sp. EM1]|nr:unnamed protein product [Phytomonas sp. EM1]|eukprot:CCW60936.1 unnamed protein product [Phytomonas sp. isolate EM1]
MSKELSQEDFKISSDEKWDHSLENFIRKASIGVCMSILPCFLLGRSAAVRGAIIALGTGFGCGVAYGEARYLFDHDIVFDKRNIVQIQAFNHKEATNFN